MSPFVLRAALKLKQRLLMRTWRFKMTIDRHALRRSMTAAFIAMSAFGITAAQAVETACPEDDGGLSLPKGFCATIFADGVGHARQMALATDGTLYLNTWSGVYYGNDKPHDGGFLVALKDTKGTG